MRLSMKMKTPQCLDTPIRRSARIPRALERYDFHVNVEEHELEDHSESSNYRDTLSDFESNVWLKTMNVEISARIPRALERYDFHVNVEEHELEDHSESSNYRDTLSDFESNVWHKTMNVEM
ncbi:hypothetical protein Tco_1271628 [Tanacetum coccineum]